jgi:hypothetical protein
VGLEPTPPHAETSTSSWRVYPVSATRPKEKGERR